MKKVGDEIEVTEASWTFEGDVYKTFDDHIKKSVPQYHEGHQLIIWISKFFLQNDSVCYDIGSSTGTLINKICNSVNKEIKFIGIEPSKGMYDYSLSKYGDNKKLNFINDDINNIDLAKSDLIISYYTMQFIHQKNRLGVIKKIYDSLNIGGAFIMYEKTRYDIAKIHDIISQSYIDFKTSNGYTEEEILSKQKSLIGVMDPNTSTENLELLKACGFKKLALISKYMYFEGILAIK